MLFGTSRCCDVFQQLPHKLGRSFDLKDDQELLESDPPGMRRHHSMQRLGLGGQEVDREAEGVGHHLNRRP